MGRHPWPLLPGGGPAGCYTCPDRAQASPQAGYLGITGQGHGIQLGRQGGERVMRRHRGAQAGDQETLLHQPGDESADHVPGYRRKAGRELPGLVDQVITPKRSTV